MSRSPLDDRQSPLAPERLTDCHLARPTRLARSITAGSMVDYLGTWSPPLSSYSVSLGSASSPFSRFIPCSVYTRPYRSLHLSPTRLFPTRSFGCYPSQRTVSSAVIRKDSILSAGLEEAERSWRSGLEFKVGCC
jgi:hypothetical protein